MRMLANWECLSRDAPFFNPPFTSTASESAAQQRSGLIALDIKITHLQYMQGLIRVLPSRYWAGLPLSPLQGTAARLSCCLLAGLERPAAPALLLALIHPRA
jgi:hypothetical protein